MSHKRNKGTRFPRSARYESKFSSSKAKVIVIGNTGSDRNITQVQVSPGSKRHGDVPYVKNQYK